MFAQASSRPFRSRSGVARLEERRASSIRAPVEEVLTAAADEPKQTLVLFSPERTASGGTASTGRKPFPTTKRLLDVVGALGVLIFFLPLMLIIAALVKVDGGPAIFAHKRLGQGGRTFSCYKFRSMHVDAEARLGRLLESDPAARTEWKRDHKLKLDPRVTKLGRFLRASSLDELPQAWNILKGDMSLVGPRPIVADEAPRYGRRIESYFRCRPGLTGLWQVSGRNDVSYRRRVALDVLYARRRSLRLDVLLVLATIPAVLSSRGSY